MNKYILKVMRYLDNPELFSVGEMRENDDDASYAAYTAEAIAYDAAYDDAAYAAAEAATYANSASAYAANACAYAANAYADCAYTANAKHWINEYFKDSDENKQDYINEVERLK